MKPTVEIPVKAWMWLTDEHKIIYGNWKVELLTNPDAKLDDFVRQSLEENNLMDLSKEVLQAQATEVLKYLNEKSKRGFGATRGNLKHITAKIKEYGIEACKKVIDAKCAQWDNDRDRHYINPITIFGREMSDNYFAMVAAQTEKQQPKTEYAPIPKAGFIPKP